MNQCCIQPTLIDFKNSRIERQKINDELTTSAIIRKDMLWLTNKTNVNIQEVQRIERYTGKSLEQIVNEINGNNTMAIILSGRISKNASRQGKTDETLQVNICNQVAKSYGITITKLKSNAYRPTKTGQIVSYKQFKKHYRSDQCLKSFDARITGQLNGWIFLKVVNGSGGHQDNVFEEADTLCEWVCNYRKNIEELYVILIDTDQHTKFDILKKKYGDVENILIVNHYMFQEYLISKYVE